MTISLFALVLVLSAAAVTVGALWLFATAAGRSLNGSAGAAAGMLVALLLGLLLQWSIIDATSGGFLAGLRAGYLTNWVDLIQNVVPDDWRLALPAPAITGSLTAFVSIIVLSGAALAVGHLVRFLTGQFAPQVDEATRGRLLHGRLKGVYGVLFLTIAACGVLLTLVPALQFQRATSWEPAFAAAPFVLWPVPGLAFGLLWAASVPVRSRPPWTPAATPTTAPRSLRSLDELFRSYEADFAPHLLLARPRIERTPTSIGPRTTPPAEAGAAGLFGGLSRRMRTASAPGDSVAPPGPPVDLSEPAPDAFAAENASRRAAREMVERVMEAARERGLMPDRRVWEPTVTEALVDAGVDLDAKSTDAAQGIVLLHEAGPTALTFLLLAEIALSTQDRGLTTLIVTAEGSVERVATEFRAALDALAAEETHRFYEGDGQPQGYYDIAATSVQRLEREILSNEDASLRDTVGRVGCIIVMDLARIDAALLRLRFVHLASLIGGRRPLVVVQGEPRKGFDSQVMSIVGAFGSYTARTLPAPLDGTTHPWLLIWRNDRPALEAVFARDVKGRPPGEKVPDLPPVALELSPFLIVRARHRKFGATFYDVAGRVDRVLWGKTLPARDFGGPDCQVLDANEREGIEYGRLPYPARDDQVIVVEDLGNLAEAVSRSINFRHLDDMLVHVVAHSYPLRDFFVDRLGEAIRHGDEAAIGGYTPIAPVPEGGLAELALAIATAVIATGAYRIGEGEIMERVEVFGTTGTRADFEGATREGLTELFARELGRRPNVIAHVGPGYERDFEFRQLDGLSLEPSYLVPTARDTTRDQRLVLLDREDHGLTYAVGTVLQLFGSYYDVKEVTKDRVRAETSRGLPTAIGDPGRGRARASNRPRYRFTRLYHALMDERDVDVHSITTTGGLLRLLARGTIERQTVAVLGYAELEPPFAFRPPQWRDLAGTVAEVRAMRLHLRFEMTAQEAQDPELPLIALTLALTLQDVLASFFPRNGERLAVMSPAAELAFRAASGVEAPAPPPDAASARGEWVVPTGQANGPDAALHGHLTAFLRMWAPRLVDRTPDREPARGLETPLLPLETARRSLSELIRKAPQATSEAARLSPGVAARYSADDRPYLDFVLIEDASHDLGCLRALSREADWGRVFETWVSYVDWCDKHGSSREDFYYRFGARQVPRDLKFAGASAFLQRWSGLDAGSGHGQA